MPGRNVKKNRGSMMKLKRGGKSMMKKKMNRGKKKKKKQLGVTMKEVKVPKANRIDRTKPVTTGEILFKKVFGMGKGKAKGGGAATKGLDYNICPSGKE